jgi:hypothetical protein
VYLSRCTAGIPTLNKDGMESSRAFPFTGQTSVTDGILVLDWESGATVLRTQCGNHVCKHTCPVHIIFCFATMFLTISTECSPPSCFCILYFVYFVPKHLFWAVCASVPMCADTARSITPSVKLECTLSGTLSDH